MLHSLFLVSHKLSSEPSISDDATVEFQELTAYVLEQLPNLLNEEHFIRIYAVKNKTRTLIGINDSLYYIDHVTANGVFYKSFSAPIDLVNDLKAIVSGIDPEEISFCTESI